MPDPEQFAEWPEYEAVPDRSAEVREARAMIYHACLSESYYFEFNVPPNVFEIRRKFLDAVSEHAEELLASLRDEVYPYLEEAEVRDRLVEWAEQHHLYKRAAWPMGLWLVDACHKTLLDWRQSSERLDALRSRSVQAEVLFPQVIGCLQRRATPGKLVRRRVQLQGQSVESGS